MKPIQRGDLVMVIRAPHTCMTEYLGLPFRVTNIYLTTGRCMRCGAEVVAFDSVGVECDGAIVLPPSWLKRLDPDALKDDVTTTEELHA